MVSQMPGGDELRCCAQAGNIQGQQVEIQFRESEQDILDGAKDDQLDGDPDAPLHQHP